jgi:hypothetical protein
MSRLLCASCARPIPAELPPMCPECWAIVPPRWQRAVIIAAGEARRPAPPRERIALERAYSLQRAAAVACARGVAA